MDGEMMQKWCTLSLLFLIVIGSRMFVKAASELSLYEQTESMLFTKIEDNFKKINYALYPPNRHDYTDKYEDVVAAKTRMRLKVTELERHQWRAVLNEYADRFLYDTFYHILRKNAHAFENFFAKKINGKAAKDGVRLAPDPEIKGAFFVPREGELGATTKNFLDGSEQAMLKLFFDDALADAVFESFGDFFELRETDTHLYVSFPDDFSLFRNINDYLHFVSLIALPLVGFKEVENNFVQPKFRRLRMRRATPGETRMLYDLYVSESFDKIHNYYNKLVEQLSLYGDGPGGVFAALRSVSELIASVSEANIYLQKGKTAQRLSAERINTLKAMLIQQAQRLEQGRFKKFTHAYIEHFLNFWSGTVSDPAEKVLKEIRKTLFSTIEIEEEESTSIPAQLEALEMGLRELISLF